MAPTSGWTVPASTTSPDGISPGAHGFLRHTDKETGVSVWWQPFTTEWDFIYTGTGKKGGY